MLRKSLRIGTTVVLGAAAAIASIAWAAPEAEAETEEASCRFAIRAENSLSFDVWVDLHESSVINNSLVLKALANWNPLNMQKHRLRRGEKLDVRYTASGRCGAERTWRFQVRTGSTPKYVIRKTKGKDDRIVDLGRSSTW